MNKTDSGHYHINRNLLNEDENEAMMRLPATLVDEDPDFNRKQLN